MTDKVRLLTELEIAHVTGLSFDSEGLRQLVALARWAAKAHAWLRQVTTIEHLHECGIYPVVAHKPPSACTCGHTALLAEITPAEEEGNDT